MLFSAISRLFSLQNYWKSEVNYQVKALNLTISDTKTLAIVFRRCFFTSPVIFYLKNAIRKEMLGRVAGWYYIQAGGNFSW